MNLVLDIGNSLVKYAVFMNGRLVHDESSTLELFVPRVKSLFSQFPDIGHSMVSSVGRLDPKARDVLALFSKVYLLSNTSKLPFKNSYASPESLGVDRLALATAAFYHNPRGNTLAIDLGSCITYDLVNDSGEYVGGAISPGLRMRYRAMHEHTADLPLLEPAEIHDFIGNSTHSGMHSGVINGMAQELDGTIGQYRSRFQDLTVILTGGDAHFFVKRLKNTIFANPKFLLEGLNYLLEYNKS